MPRWLYSLLLRLSLPIVLAAMAWRGWRQPVHRSDLRARLAMDQRRLEGAPLWLHGSSVGEVQAAAGLIRLLREHHPSMQLLLTTWSATGYAHAQQIYGELLKGDDAGGRAPLTLRYAPFDLPGAARRFLAANQPCGLVLLETELWPNLIAAASVSGLPLAMVSARVSERSTQSYLRLARGMMRETLAAMELIGAQSDADADRFRRLGARPDSLEILGNLKFDFPLPPDAAVRGARLRERCAPGRPLWVAGSTHPVEEEHCLTAQRELLRRAAAAGSAPPLLVLAPRRPERFDAVAEALAGQSLRTLRWSQRAAIPGPLPQADVLLLDTLGELLGFYAAADFAFVGGSLVPVGGHNLLEPAALGRVTLTGPHTHNAPEAAELLEAADALTRVKDGESLAESLWSFMQQPQRAAAQGARAAAAVAANRGAARRCLAALRPLLPQLGRTRRP